MHTTQSASSNPMIESKYMSIYVIILVNKSHYWLAVSILKTYVVKLSFIVQEK